MWTKIKGIVTIVIYIASIAEKLTILKLWELLHQCWQWCANACNSSKQCWDLQCIMGWIQPIRLCEPCVRPTMLEELCKWIQNCCTTLQQSRNKRNVTTGDNMQPCANQQYVTSNNVGSCRPTILHLFVQGFIALFGVKFNYTYFVILIRVKTCILTPVLQEHSLSGKIVNARDKTLKM